MKVFLLIPNKSSFTAKASKFVTVYNVFFAKLLLCPEIMNKNGPSSTAENCDSKPSSAPLKTIGVVSPKDNISRTELPIFEKEEEKVSTELKEALRLYDKAKSNFLKSNEARKLKKKSEKENRQKAKSNCASASCCFKRRKF